VITATAIGLALTLWAKGTALQAVRRRLDAEYAQKFATIERTA